AGPRVIEQFMHIKLPEDAGSAEFLLERGMLDLIVPRHKLRQIIARLLQYYVKPATRKQTFFQHREERILIEN
ncbi:MAG: acetyl-CoA carboxylase carboxyl transferase subunit beta, partial [Ktedonobacteraceae bacterium]